MKLRKVKSILMYTSKEIKKKLSKISSCYNNNKISSLKWL